MTDKENWQDKPGEGESSARRDGERNSDNKGSEPKPWHRQNDIHRDQNGSNDRPRRSFSDNNSGSYNRGGNSSDRPRRPFGEGNNDRPHRPNGDSGNSFNNNFSPRRPFGDGNSDRPNRPFGDGNSDRPQRPYSESGNRFGGQDRERNSFDRPRRSFGEGNSDRPQRPSSESGNRFGGQDRERNSFDRPRRSNGEGSSDRPNRPFGEGNSDRPRRSFDENNSERPRRPYGDNDNDRPRRTSGEGGNHFGNQSREGGFDRPRRSFGEGGNRFGGGESNENNSDRPRRSFGDAGSDRPRRSFGDAGSDRPHRSGGEGFGSQYRPSFRGPSLPKPERSDGKARRPRIKRETSFDHGTPYGRPSNNQPILDPNEPIRLNKYLANAGICSRREADEFIQAGVVKVNGETVTQLGVKVKPVDTILFHDQQVSIERKIYILLNKPKDCVTTSDDPQERLTVMDLVKGACYERIYPVGRLDRNTTGVLLLTNDGDLASKLTHPKFEKRKIYQVTLDNDLTEADFKTILEGVTLDEELIKVDNLSYVDPDSKCVIGIEIHSGQNRVVRRIFESLGYKVFKLDRVYFAGLTKKNLPRGKWRHLSDKEVSLLKMGAFV